MGDGKKIMNNFKKYTVYFIGLVIVAIAVYDVIVIVNGGTEASISHTMIVWSYKYPVFTFLMGFVMGHLFWRMSDTIDTKKITEFVKGQKDDIPKH